MMTDQQAIIDDIRRCYGIGLDGAPEHERAVAELRANLNSAIEELSRDLYSRESHFVLELIQNAEDNEYDDPHPFLKFRIDSGAILVQNNERGFREENVRSLCRVGKSTKTKARGYIGEKGIGFKSVFRVSDAPCIVSNGFQFRLRSKSDGDELRFILPEWTEHVPPAVDPALTNIVLPLNERAGDEVSKLDQIDPGLLLFLKKLKFIEVENTSSGGTPYYVRKHPCEDGFLGIEHPDGRDRWKLVARPVAVPESLLEEKRQGVQESELVLAFPVKQDNAADFENERPLYAFLPVERTYGFRFVIRADFLQPASREDIHKNSKWNEWLRDEIPAAFLDAVEAFKTPKNLRHTFYGYIPLVSQITDPFFRLMILDIHERLRHAARLLSESGTWSRPDEVLEASPQVRALIPNADLQTLLQLEYLSPEIQASREVLDVLHVEPFKYSHLLQCLKNAEWLEKQTDEWFIHLYTFLHRVKPPDSVVEALRELPIVRLASTSRLVSTADTVVFFPLEAKREYGFEEELAFVKRVLVTTGGDAARMESHAFLERLGVTHANSLHLIDDHILPVFKGTDRETNWISKGDPICFGYLRYIKEHLDEYLRVTSNANALTDLGSSVWVKYKHPENCWYSHPMSIYLGQEYGNARDLETLLGGIDDIRFVDPQYLALDTDRVVASADQGDAHTISGWASFFRRLGMEDFIREQDFRQIVATGDVDRVGLAFFLLDDHWARSTTLLCMQTSTVNRRGYSLPGGFVPTEFCRWLSDRPCIPTTRNTLAKPGLVFLDKPEIRALLGDTVEYVGIPLENPQLVAALGIRTEATVTAALFCLQQLAAARSTDKEWFERLCQFLDRQFPSNEQAIRTAFRKTPLVYVPGSSFPYRTTAHLFWNDLSRVFGVRYGYLERPYPGLRQFFLDRLQIALTAGPSDYSGLLIELSRNSALPSRDEGAVQKCYEELEAYLRVDEHRQAVLAQSWWTALRENAVCWTERREFHIPQKTVFLNDNEDLHALFRDEQALQFVKLPRNHHPRYRHLFRMLGVRRLSESVTLSFNGREHYHVHRELTDQARRFAGYVARYLYWHEHDLYRKLKNNKTLDRLSAVQVRVVATLQATYSLEGISVSAHRKAFADDHLYVQDDATQDGDVLGLELVRLWGKPKGLEAFLVTLFEKRDSVRIELYLQASDTPALPDDESDHPSKPASAKSGVLPEGTTDATSKTGPAPFPAPSDDRPPEAAVEAPSSHAPSRDKVTTDSLGTERTSDATTHPHGTRTGEAAGEGMAPSEPNAQASRDDRKSPSSTGRGDTGKSTGTGELTRGRDATRTTESAGGQRRPDGAHESKGEAKASGKSAAKRSKNRKRKSGTVRKDRVVTYVGQGEPDPKSLEESELASEESQFRINLGKAAVETVRQFEVEHGREPTVLGQTHAGYDIVSTECQSDSGCRKRKIEVKGINGEWSDRGVSLTRTQFETACRLGDEFWLYVVENANDPDPGKKRVYPIQNPAARITEYRFDMGWRLLAQSDERR